MTEESLLRYYAEDFGSLRHMQGQIVNAKVNAAMMARLVNLKRVRTLLDIGTGYGFLLKELSGRFGIAATGVELSRREAAYGVENLGVDIKNCFLADAGIPKESYDLVTAFEVIEHAPDPQAFINEMSSYVKHNGHLIVMTDNFTSAAARALGAGFPKWIPHAHVSHFSPETLERVLTSAGLQVVRRLSYTPWEIGARRIINAFRGTAKTPSEMFHLEEVLATEMAQTYRMFHVRRTLNSLWARLTAAYDTGGALIYFLARKHR